MAESLFEVLGGDEALVWAVVSWIVVVSGAVALAAMQANHHDRVKMRKPTREPGSDVC